MQTRNFVSSAVVAFALVLCAIGSVYAMANNILTTDDKSAIFTRCSQAGGSFKVCCAAADGKVTKDPKTGSTYCKFTLKVSGGNGAGAQAPTGAMSN